MEMDAPHNVVFRPVLEDFVSLKPSCVNLCAPLFLSRTYHGITVSRK